MVNNTHKKIGGRFGSRSELYSRGKTPRSSSGKHRPKQLVLGERAHKASARAGLGTVDTGA